MEVYHGFSSQRSDFRSLLEVLASFLQKHSGETIIVCLKDEVRDPTFSKLLRQEMMQYQGFWYLEDRFPCLGEVRGKVVVMSRFPLGTWTQCPVLAHQRSG
jgi:1-phosphatidylinositol phosphodiesterase